jgi:hypothetical protein
MKNNTALFLFALFSLLGAEAFSQSLMVRPYVELGVDFLQSGALRRQYDTQSKSFVGIGVQYGHPKSASIIPFVQYSMSTFRTDRATDGTLQTNQFAGGVIVPFFQMESAHFRTRFGYSYAMIEESFQDIDSNAHGFLIGLGIEKSIIRNSRVFLDVTYNYQKSANTGFKDFDMLKLSIGFVL